MIKLRDLRLRDKEMIRQWRNLPEVAKYMYTNHQITQDEHEKWFQRILDDASSRYWIIECDAQDVGLVNVYHLDKKNLRCYWAFYVSSPDVRGKGVGSFVEYSILNYVFEELNLNKLCCEVLMDNEAVINMHKSFGFVQEGIFREHVIKGEKHANIVSLSMLRCEWKALKSKIAKRLMKKGLL